jgi:hypothetical protein
VPQRYPKSRKRLYQSTRAALDGIRTTQAEMNQKSADFLKIDVETALIFSKIALESYDSAKKQRNRKNARKGYDTILRLKQKVVLGEDDVRYLSGQLQQLKSNLQSLGEVF